MRNRKNPFKGRQFTAEVILWAVRWYLQFPISYRDLELMLRDRGVSVDHTTVYRWIQAYAVELEKRLRPHLRPTNGSWRVDETYMKVKGRWVYLYRAVDSRGHNIVEQDHRRKKRLVRPGLGFKRFRTAWRTLVGDETLAMMRKGQVKGISGDDIVAQAAFVNSLFDIAA
jgi:transposase-like protein